MKTFGYGIGENGTISAEYKGGKAVEAKKGIETGHIRDIGRSL
jgi:hypothetical protein